MIEYKELYTGKGSNILLEEINQDLNKSSNWVESYWIGKYAYSRSSSELDTVVIEAYEKAFNQGLNIQTDRNLFLDATQELAKIYFQYKQYEDALNKLLLFDTNSETTPDWVHLYFASAQIHMEYIFMIAKSPKLFFSRLDLVNSNQEFINKRNILFLEFLNILTHLIESDQTVEICKSEILSKSESYGLYHSRENSDFLEALGMEATFIETSDDSDDNYEASDIIIGLTTTVETLISENALLKETITRSTNENQSIKKLLNQYESDLDKLNAKFFASEDRLTINNSKIQGDEESHKIIDEYSTRIREIKAELITFYEEHKQSEAEKSNLRIELEKERRENSDLREVLLNMKSRITELEYDIANVQPKLSGGKDLKIIENEQDVKQIFDVKNFENFLIRGKKILIIGGSRVKPDQIIYGLRNRGYLFNRDQLVFELDYDNIKSYTERILPWGGKYAGIIVGPCPHSCKDNEGYSSFIEKIIKGEGYPHVEKATDKSGTLKITKESVADAMQKMAVHLSSIN